MQAQNSDKDLDRLIKALVRDNSADETTLNEIAASPALLWNVRKRIMLERKSVASPWPPSFSVRSWLAIGTSVVAAAVLFSLLLIPAPEMPADEAVRVTITDTRATAEVQSKNNNFAAEPQPVKSTLRANLARSNRRTRLYGAKLPIPDPKPKIEIKSDYIALTYAGVPESGHVLRVKVPGSMMVSLGLVSSVEKPSALVDADVVIGDDGQTHAIRFIRY